MRREELEAGMEGEALVSGELKTDRTNRNTLCSDVIMDARSVCAQNTDR